MKLADLYSIEFHRSLKTQVEETYTSYLSELVTDIEETLDFSSLSDEFKKKLPELLGARELQAYSPIKFYWLNLLDDLFLICDIHESASEESTHDLGHELSEIEDEIFNFWNDTDFAASFHALLESDHSIFSASEKLIPILENQLLSILHLHCLKEDHYLSFNLLYTVIPELGDSPEYLYLGDQHKFIRIENPIESFPTISLNAISHIKGEIDVERSETHVDNYKVQDQHPYLKVKKTKLHILPNCQKSREQIESIRERISKALGIIKQASPKLHDVFSSFTHTIIPVDEPGIVSYSMQNLPGYSSINTFERDFVDLLDDLLHENGHHFLNTFLNLNDLIEEDDEKIYYSAWRRSLRPVRGIYHAYCTFFWAYKLFSELINNGLEHFNEEEQIKIHKRFCEEYLMLQFTYVDILKAYDDKKVQKEGLELVKVFQEDLDSSNDFFLNVLATLKEKSPDALKEIQDLEKHLEEKRAEYKL